MLWFNIEQVNRTLNLYKFNKFIIYDEPIKNPKFFHFERS